MLRHKICNDYILLGTSYDEVACAVIEGGGDC